MNWFLASCLQGCLGERIEELSGRQGEGDLGEFKAEIKLNWSSFFPEITAQRVIDLMCPLDIFTCILLILRFFIRMGENLIFLCTFIIQESLP